MSNGTFQGLVIYCIVFMKELSLISTRMQQLLKQKVLAGLIELITYANASTDMISTKCLFSILYEYEIFFYGESNFRMFIEIISPFVSYKQLLELFDKCVIEQVRELNQEKIYWQVLDYDYKMHLYIKFSCCQYERLYPLETISRIRFYLNYCRLF